MSENTKGTEPRVLHEWVSADLTDRQVGRVEIGRFRGECFTRTRAADGWTGWTHANADDAEIARLAASNRALVEQNERLRESATALEVVRLFTFPGEGIAEKYDRVADWFYAETGLMAPGKDRPAAMGSQGDATLEYKDWMNAKITRAWSALQSRAALSPDPAPSAEPVEKGGGR